MRDVSFKPTTRRTATARAELLALSVTIERVQRGDTPKGDPVPVAKVAAIQATKKTTEWIPYCHNIPIEHVDVKFFFEADRIAVEVFVISIARTGVEMEAITAAAAAVITLYDMLKMIDEGMEIGSIRLLAKTGGKSDLPSSEGWSAAVVVASDRASRGEYEDKSGPILAEGLRAHGASGVTTSVVSDDASAIEQAITSAVSAGAKVVVVTGGTGLGPRDVTSATVAKLVTTPLPGVVAAFQSYSQDRVPTAMLARPVAGIMQGALLLAIPGSPGACRDALGALFPSVLHAWAMLEGGGH